MLSGTVYTRMKIAYSYLAWKKNYILSKCLLIEAKEKKLANVNSFYQIVQANYSLPLKKYKGQKANI